MSSVQFCRFVLFRMILSIADLVTIHYFANFDAVQISNLNNCHKNLIPIKCANRVFWNLAYFFLVFVTRCLEELGGDGGDNGGHGGEDGLGMTKKDS